jgi:hypothetical protein
MLDPARHHDELAFVDPFVTIAEIHAKAALDHEEHFVFVLVMVKDELALDLIELDMLPVKLGRNVGLPVLSNLREFFGDADLGHEASGAAVSVLAKIQF